MVKVENGQDETWQILVAVQIPISLSQAWLNTSTTARNRALPKRSTPANKAGLDLSRKNGTMDQLETLIIFFSLLDSFAVSQHAGCRGHYIRDSAPQRTAKDMIGP